MSRPNSQRVESNNHSTDIGANPRNKALPPLNYNLKTPARIRSITIFFTLLFLEAGFLPLILFYALKLGAHLSSRKNLAIITSVVGTFSGYKFAVRMWYLWIAKDSFEWRPIGARRWDVDASQIILSLALLAFLTPLIIGSSVTPASPATVAMAVPCLILTLCVPLLITGLFPHRLRVPFRVSSLPAYEGLPPATFTLVEDIVAVDGRGGLTYRKAWLARYEASDVMRRVVRNQALFWGIGGSVAAVAIIVVCWTTAEDVAYGVGYGAPWVWAIVWTWISIASVRRELRNEQVRWMVRPESLEMSLNVRGSGDSELREQKV